MKLDDLKDLYIEQLRDLYNAENQLVEALPEMRDAATHPELKDAFSSHLEETRQHVSRLEQVFDRLNEDPSGEKCEAMEGLLEEAREMINQQASKDVRDAGLITSAQRIEHYEMAGYGTVATYAEELDRSEDHDVLGRTLQEEEGADEKLTRLAKNVVNMEAVPA